ncbi:MAG: hypothetical protein Q8876_08215 [Bacillota bacterium]|nr:hypothetical protein [Bacillota bacterium]
MEIKRWAKDPSNFDYIKYIYNIHKKGIAKELLNKLEFKLKV